jgi:hypothetical protein
MSSEPSLEALLERVRRLEEIETARNLLHRYAETLDQPTPETVAALFTPDGALHTRLGDCVGREQITTFFRDRLATDRSEKRHFIVSPRTTWLGPGRVAIAAYFLFTGRGDDRSILGWGTYDDVVRIVDGEALFEDKTIELHVGTDLQAGWPSDRSG